MEGSLDGAEGHDRTIGSSSLAAVDGESNGVVEGETEGGVSLLATLATVEELVLDLLDNREEHCNQ